MKILRGISLYKLVPVFLFGVGITLFIVFLNNLGFSNLIEHLSELSVFAIIVFIVNASLISVFPAIAWYVNQKSDGNPISIYDSIKSHVMGFPINVMTPSAYLGSEPLKIFYIVQKYGYKTSRVIATLMVTKFQEFASLMLVLMISLIWLISKEEALSKGQEILFVCVGTILIAGLTILLYVYANGYKPITKLFLVMKLLKRDRLIRIANKIKSVEETVHVCINKRWKSYLFAQFITLFSAVSILLRPVIIPAFSGRHMDLMSLQNIALIYIVANIIFSFQIIPCSLGVFEYGLYGLSGLTKESVAMFSVFTRVSDLVLFLVGLVLLVHFGLTEFLSAKKARKELKAISKDNNSSG
ncbi:MAG: flippase-like domain-containing protein [Planctomycetes bacterium]|nr:flippase-like domain-containing protein [Planctomycetota bacterium]